MHGKNGQNGRARDAGNLAAFLHRLEIHPLAQPLPGVIQAHDVATLALYLASDAAHMVTGQVFVIDGGQQAGLYRA